LNANLHFLVKKLQRGQLVKKNWVVERTCLRGVYDHEMEDDSKGTRTGRGALHIDGELAGLRVRQAAEGRAAENRLQKQSVSRAPPRRGLNTLMFACLPICTMHIQNTQ